MKIGKPTSNVPGIGPHANSKYAKIWGAVRALNSGDWLPVEFEDKKQAYNFYLAAKTHRTLSLDVVSRATTIYVRQKQSEK